MIVKGNKEGTYSRVPRLSDTLYSAKYRLQAAKRDEMRHLPAISIYCYVRGTQI